MGWREDLIELYKKEVERLRGDIPLMRAGTFQFSSYENGQWVITNEECIARDLKTIEELEGIIARAEAEGAGNDADGRKDQYGTQGASAKVGRKERRLRAHLLLLSS